MTYPIINLSQIRQILSGKVQIEDFDSSKRYLNGTIIKYNNNLYCSIIDIEPNEFNENQWKKIPFDDEINISLGNLSQNINEHISNIDNPHNVTKTQVGLSNVDNTSDADKPISKATQEALDLKADKNDTYTKLETDDLLDKKLDIDTASSTYETIINANNHKNDTNNPHNVTKTQIGLGNVDNTSDADKPISTATQEALDLKANQSTTYTKLETDDLLDKKLDIDIAEQTYETITNVNNHKNNTNNPHNVTKAQIGLGNVDNTSDINKPISKATQEALDLKANQSNVYTKTESDNLLDKKLDIDTAEQTYETITNVNNHISNVDNPHKVTKAQIGLGNVDNTSDLDKPISTATQEVLDLKQDNLIEGERIIINNNIISTTATRIIMREW